MQLRTNGATVLLVDYTGQQNPRRRTVRLRPEQDVGTVQLTGRVKMDRAATASIVVGNYRRYSYATGLVRSGQLQRFHRGVGRVALYWRSAGTGLLPAATLATVAVRFSLLKDKILQLIKSQNSKFLI